MADVMIVLLIIFMVAAPIIAGAPVRLPEAARASEHKAERIEIALRTDGRVAIDGTTLASADLLAAYLEARSPAPESVMVLAR